MARAIRRSSTQLVVRQIYETRSFHRRFLASLSDPIDRLVICSPYFGALPPPFKDVLQFCIEQQRRGVHTVEIITRPPGAPDAAMSTTMAGDLARSGVDLFVRVQPYLHAKFYHFEYSSGTFRSFVGSSNFTKGGLERNYEVVAEIEGVGANSPCHTAIAKMQGPGVLPYTVWVGRGCPGGAEERA